MQNKWLWGCGIGCGVIIVLMGLIGIGLATYGVKYAGKMTSALNDELSSHFEQLKKEGKVRPELQEPIAETLTLLRRPETPFFVGMTILGLLTQIIEPAATENKPIDPEKALAAVTDFRDLLRAKPAPTQDEFTVLYLKHKDLMDSLHKPDSTDKEWTIRIPSGSSTPKSE